MDRRFRPFDSTESTGSSTRAPGTKPDRINGTSSLRYGVSEEGPRDAVGGRRVATVLVRADVTDEPGSVSSSLLWSDLLHLPGARRRCLGGRIARLLAAHLGVPAVSGAA